MNIAQDYIAKLSDPAYQGANLVVVRKIEETNRDSTFAELQAAIYRMFGPYADRFWKVNLNPLALECKITGNRIIFRGVKDQRQREKIKSITFKNGKLVWIWCEEATELLPEDVDILDDRLRGNLDDLNPNLYYPVSYTHLGLLARCGRLPGPPGGSFQKTRPGRCPVFGVLRRSVCKSVHEGGTCRPS